MNKKETIENYLNQKRLQFRAVMICKIIFRQKMINILDKNIQFVRQKIKNDLAKAWIVKLLTFLMKLKFRRNRVRGEKLHLPKIKIYCTFFT